MAKWFKRMLAVLVTAGVMVVVGTSPALAFGPDGCGYTCDGKDPQYFNIDPVLVNGRYIYAHCSWDAVDKRTVTATDSGGKLQIILRYSPNCRTAWAKPNVLAGFNPYSAYWVWVESYWNTSGSFRTAYNSYNQCSGGSACSYGGSAWSLMVNDANIYARACVMIEWTSGNEGGPWHDTTTCTSLY